MGKTYRHERNEENRNSRKRRKSMMKDKYKTKITETYDETSTFIDLDSIFDDIDDEITK